VEEGRKGRLRRKRDSEVVVEEIENCFQATVFFRVGGLDLMYLWSRKTKSPLYFWAPKYRALQG